MLITGRAGLRALGEALAGLQEARPATLIVAPDGLNAEVLQEALGLEFCWATPGTVLRPGLLYVARLDVTVEFQADRLTATPLPAPDTAAPLDALLRSVAAAVGSRSLTVILSPADVAGGAGVQALSAAGSTVLHITPGAGLGHTLSLLIRPAPHGRTAADEVTAQAAAVLERMGDAHCLLDGAFVIRSVNAAAERLLGMSRNHLIGRSHWEAFPGSVDPAVGRALRRVVQDGAAQHLTHHYTGEGYDLHLEMDAYPTDEGGVSMFWRDVTERVRAEAALRESEAKYRALFTEMDEAYAVVEVLADDTGRWVDFLFLDANPVFVRHTGMPEPVGRTARELLGTPNPRWAELYGQVAETGVPLRVEEGEVTLGRVFDLNIFRLGGVGSRQVAVLFTDITDRRRREAHQTFLLDLTEALSVLQGEAEMVRAAGARLAEYLHLSSYHYVDVDEDRAEVTVRHSWHALDVPPVLGTYPIAGFISPEGLGRLRAGEPNVINDVLAEVPDDTAAGQGLKAGADAQKIRAYVAVPFSQDRRWNGYFAVADSQPRVWSAPEVELIQEVSHLVFPRVQRARALSALREREHKYRSLFEEMNEGFALCEVVRDAAGQVVDYRYLDLNPALVRHGGFSPEALRGRRATEAFPNLDPWLIGTYAQVVDEGRTVTVERHYPHVDRWMHISAFPRGDDRFAVLFTDITYRKRREHQQAFLLAFSDHLRTLTDEKAIEDASLRMLAQFLRLDRAYIFVLSPAEDRAVVRAEHRQEHLASLVGEVRMSEFPETVRQIEDETIVFHDIDSDPRLSDLNRASLAAVNLQAFVCASVRQGERNVVWSLAAAAVTRRTWTNDEVELIELVAERLWAAGERAKAQADLRASEVRFRAVANLVPDLLWESRPDGFTDWYNQRWLEYTGQTFEQASGWGWTDAIHPEDREQSARRYRKYVELGRALRQDHLIRRHDGEYRWFVIHTVPVRGEAGEVLRVYGAATDIHDLREQAAMLETRVTERTRRLTELNAELMARTRALEGFSHLTRDLGLDTDRVTLIRRAQELVMGLLPEGFAAYYEPDGDVWRLHSQVGDTRHPALQTLMDAGLPLNSPSFIHPFRSGRAEYQAAYVPGTDTDADLAEHVHSTAALPVRLGGAPLGLFAVVQFEDRMWSPADRALLETVVQHLNLALDRAEAVRRLAEEREALRAFAGFTELAARTSDVQLLAQQATDVLTQVLGADVAVYFEREGEVWKGRASAGAATPAMEQRIREGVPAGATSFMMPAARREPMFFNHWQAGQNGLSDLDAVQALAAFPMFPQDHPVGVLTAVKLRSPIWRERERAIFQAVGEALRLTLERTAQVQQIDRQRGRLADLNAELGTLITRTAHQLDAPARQLEDLLSPGRIDDPGALDGLSSLDPLALQDEVKRLRAVAQDLRELSVLEVQPLASDLLALGELVSEVREQVRVPGREVTWFIEPLPIVRGDRAFLKQALNVLMSFTLSATRGARFVTVSSREAEGEVRLVFEDDGVGLSGEEAATLFDLAVRTDQEVPLIEGGGLIQVRRILARHGGWAWAEAQRTGGRVVLAFPQEAAAGELDALLLGDGPRP